jgi:hypothetical protein
VHDGEDHLERRRIRWGVGSGSEEGRVAHLSQVFDGMIQMRREEMENSWGKKRKAFILQVQKELEQITIKDQKRKRERKSGKSVVDLALAFVWQMLQAGVGSLNEEQQQQQQQRVMTTATATAMVSNSRERRQ